MGLLTAEAIDLRLQRQLLFLERFNLVPPMRLLSRSVTDPLPPNLHGCRTKRWPLQIAPNVGLFCVCNVHVQGLKQLALQVDHWQGLQKWFLQVRTLSHLVASTRLLGSSTQRLSSCCTLLDARVLAHARRLVGAVAAICRATITVLAMDSDISWRRGNDLGWAPQQGATLQINQERFTPLAHPAQEFEMDSPQMLSSTNEELIVSGW
jgi:hypothetical protein